HLVNNFDQKKFNKAANLIMEAENIYIAGHGSSHYIAGLSAFLLQRVGHRAFHLNNSNLSFIEQLVNIRKDDLLIEFSFPPYFSNTTMAAEFAKKQKAGVISITNSVVAPVTKHSSVSLIVKTENQILTNSMTPIIVLLYTLIDEVAVKDKERSKNTIRKLISTREEN
ncbi:MAG: MurR/RpiR family transcriptional regulator, partial [Rhodothermaceae bacterium]